MRKRQKVLALFFIPIFFFSFSLLGIQTVAAVDSSDYPVILENFQITTTSTTYNPHAFCEIVGKSISNFKNMGIIEKTDSSITFKATLDLNINVAFYTDYDLTNCFSSITKSTKSTKWLHLVADDNWVEAGAIDGRSYYDLYSYYTSYSYGALSAPGINSNYQFEVNFASLEDKYLEITNQNASILTIESPKATVLEMRIHDADIVSLDTYTDVFSTAVGQAKLDAIDLRQEAVKDKVDSSNWDSDVAATITGKIESLAVGVTKTSMFNETLQQGNAVARSQVMDKVGDNTYQVLVVNKPEVINFYDMITTRAGNIEVDTKDGFWIKDAGIRYCAPVVGVDTKRNGGYRVNNNLVETNITSKIALFSTIQISAEDQAYYLGHTEFYKGDVVWDLSLTGDTGLSLIFSEPAVTSADLWYVWLIIAIVIGIAVYIVLKIYFPGIFAGRNSKKSVSIGKFFNYKSGQ